MNSHTTTFSGSRRPGPPRSPWPFRRTWAVARVTFRQGIRMHWWVMAPLAVLVLIAVDLSAPRFDPVFEAIPAAVGTTLFIMTALAVLVGVFFATSSIPAEVETRVAYTLVTKPVGPLELVAGKTLGMSLVLLVMLGFVWAGAYAYFVARGSDVRTLAERRREEALPRARYETDLNALEAVVRRGPLLTYHYCQPDSGPHIVIQHPAGAVPDGNVRWILGDSGARLQWDLADTPLRSWIALYGAFQAAAQTAEAARGALRLNIQARDAGDEVTTREAFGVGMQKLRDAADAWDRAARLWENHSRALAQSTPPAPEVEFYRTIATALGNAAEAFARLPADLTQENVRELIARIPDFRLSPWHAQLILDLEVRAPPEAPDQPTPVILHIVPLTLGSAQGAEAVPNTEAARYTLNLEMTDSRALTVPLVLPDSEMSGDVLRLPARGDLRLELRCRGSGHLVGLKPAAVRLVGPAGETVQGPKEPQLVSESFRRRQWIYGRTAEPRQVAVFRFNDVPRDILGRGNIPVEVGFALAAWSPAILGTTARIVFVKPGTDESVTISFSPEMYHSSLLYLDRNFWNGGPLEARIECLTNGDSFGFLPESVRLRLDGGSFAWNFAKATLEVWLFGTVLAAAGVFLSTRFSWFVSIFAAITLFIVCMSRQFILSATPIGEAARELSSRAGASSLWTWLTGFFVPPIPNLRSLLPDNGVSLGEVLPLASLATTFGWAALFVLVTVLLGAYLLKTREVAG
jgi:hypothetical protein